MAHENEASEDHEDEKNQEDGQNYEDEQNHEEQQKHAADDRGNSARDHEEDHLVEQEVHQVQPTRQRVERISRGRIYHISVPIRPLSGHVRDEYLDRIALYYTICGVLFAIGGAVAIVLPLFFGLAIPTVLASVLVFCGSITLLQFLLICGAPGTLATLLLGALHLAVGLWLLLEPIAGSTALTFIFCLWFLAHGVLKIVMTIGVRKLTTWPVVLVSGIASWTLAVVCLALTPKLGLELVSTAFGGDLAFTGIAMLLVSLMAYLGKGHRSITDAEALRETLLGGQAASSA